MSANNNPDTPTVDASTLVDFLSASHAARTPVMIYGAPGVGKSEIVEQFGERIGYAVLDVRLSYMLPETIGPIYYPDAKGKCTTALKPAIIAQIEELHAATKKPVLVFLDEITTASSETLKASLELLLKGAIAGFKPSCETYIIAAGNRPEDTPEAIYLPVPTRTRFFSVLFNPTLIDLAVHIHKAFPRFRLAEAVCDFLATHEARRLIDRDTIADGIDPVFTPRGLFKALQAVEPICNGDNAKAALENPTVSLIMRAAVGTAFVSRLMAHIELNSAISDAGKILENPKAAAVPSDPQAILAQLQALSQAVESRAFGDGPLTALMDYIDRCQPESVRIWANNERGVVLAAIGKNMRGRRMLTEWGIATPTDPGKARAKR